MMKPRNEGKTKTSSIPTCVINLIGGNIHVDYLINQIPQVSESPVAPRDYSEAININLHQMHAILSMISSSKMFLEQEVLGVCL